MKHEKRKRAVRCTGWVEELEAALWYLKKAMKLAIEARDFSNWDELADAEECLVAASESQRRRSSTD